MSRKLCSRYLKRSAGSEFHLKLSAWLYISYASTSHKPQSTAVAFTSIKSLNDWPNLCRWNLGLLLSKLNHGVHCVLLNPNLIFLIYLFFYCRYYAMLIYFFEWAAIFIKNLPKIQNLQSINQLSMHAVHCIKKISILCIILTQLFQSKSKLFWLSINFNLPIRGFPYQSAK